MSDTRKVMTEMSVLRKNKSFVASIKNLMNHKKIMKKKKSLWPFTHQASNFFDPFE
jgi:hypothetical protein